MSLDPLVSIIIPTYRRADTLKRALESAFSQTYENIEIIVVDDNADNLEDRVSNREVLAEYPDVIIVENSSNLGGGLSRNEGAKAAKGVLLAFLDDDDEFMPRKIEEQVKTYLEASRVRDVGIVYCHAEVIRVDGTIYTWTRMDSGYPLRAHILSCVAPSTALLIPLDAFWKVGGFEDISSRQDATLIMKLVMSGHSIEVTPSIQYRYFWHDGTNGITNITEKTLQAELQYRGLFNEYSEKYPQIISRGAIESAFSKRIVVIMLKLDQTKAALSYLASTIKKYPLRLDYAGSFLKIVFKSYYLRISYSREVKSRIGRKEP